MERFSKVYLEITNVCNLACDFCPKSSRPAAFLSVSDFRETLEQLKPYTTYLYLHVKGEPLLHPDLSMLLDICHEMGFQINITTNRTLIRRQHEMLLSKSAVRQINFSLHSFDGNEICHSREEYIADILDFAKEAQHRSRIIVSLRLWNLTAASATMVDELALRRNDELLSMIETAFDLPFRIQEEVIAARGIKLSDRIYLNQAQLFEWPDLAAQEYPGRAFCYGLRNQIGILVDGTVIPCCLDGEGVIELGNIYGRALAEILESPRSKAIYDGFSRKEAVEELCKRCGYRQRFGT